MELSSFLTNDLSGSFLDIIVFRIVDVDFDLSQSIEDFLAGVVDQFRQGAIQLFDGDIHSLVGLGPDNIHDCLSLGQIDPTVQEGPLGKFTRFGQTSSLTDDQLQDFIGHSDPAVGIDLDDVFSGEGLR